MPATECVLCCLCRGQAFLPGKAIKLRRLCCPDFPGQLLFKCHYINSENGNFAIDPREFMSWELGMDVGGEVELCTYRIFL